MTNGNKHLDLSVVIPLLIGAAACVLQFSKLMDYILGRAYAALYHAIIGFVIASTLIHRPLRLQLPVPGRADLLAACGGRRRCWPCNMSRLEEQIQAGCLIQPPCPSASGLPGATP
jgi:hypothetical protein